MKNYDHKAIEQKWQKEWARNKIYTTSDAAPDPDAQTGTKENFYLLVEFPYPSGNLHVGHWYAFALPDILARYHRMQGKNVLYPIGFDAFGLPAENAAIKNKLNPRDWTLKNIGYMEKQIESMGTSFDWSRKTITCDPDYYRWTQWLFLQLYKKGLVYRKETSVNWCPNDKTVLANEQVVSGRCERCDAEVVQKEMLQWNIKITDYADRLIEDLAPLDWPKEIKESQKNWIGRSEGAEIDFPLPEEAVKRFVLLHGRDSSSNGAFMQWLKAKLEERGYEVQVPDMPNPAEPNDQEQAEYVRKNCTLDEHTAIVGHSFGGIVALRLLEGDVKVARTTFVATPYSGQFSDRKRRPTVEAALKRGFDFDSIKRNSHEFIALYDPEDPIVPLSDGEELSTKLNSLLLKAKAEHKHFTGKLEPEVLRGVAPTITVFTTRPDTLFGATYLVLAPEHSWLKLATDEQHDILSNKNDVKAYVEKAKRKTELERLTDQKEKTGVRLEGVFATNPATGDSIPIFVADYVLGHYGSGAIMAVPAHDERDFEFAKKFNLPMREVVSGGHTDEAAHTGDGAVVNSGEFNGMSNKDAQKEIAARFGRAKTTYKLRDWIVSRQRYWGVPIPIIHCEKCGYVPVQDEALPVLLPEIEDYLPAGDGKSPLAKARDWVEVICPTCGGKGERETDTLDTFVDSSWYFIRYTDPRNGKEFAARDKQGMWMPVDLYSGGAEHTTMHLLYSRFWHKALFDMGLVNDSEPYKKRMNRSLILGPDGQKMSKSRGNVIDPDAIVELLGADTVRLYLAFIGPYNEVSSYPWNPNGVVGVRRFIERIFKVAETVQEADVLTLEVDLHSTLKKVGEDIVLMKFNTAVSALMILLNAIESEKSIGKSQWKIFLKMLAPFAPHAGEELWHDAGETGSIHTEYWSVYDERVIASARKTVVVQVNGKRRADVVVPAGTSDADLEITAKDAAKAYLEGKEIARTVVVPGRLVNFVLK